jgi:hypothetical protein
LAPGYRSVQYAMQLSLSSAGQHAYTASRINAHDGLSDMPMMKI